MNIVCSAEPHTAVLLQFCLIVFARGPVDWGKTSVWIAPPVSTQLALSVQPFTIILLLTSC